MVFPTTAWSAVLAAQNETAEQRKVRFDRLIRSYWKAVYICARAHFTTNHEDACDLTQSFFKHMIEHGVLDDYDPARGRFRTYVRTALRQFASRERIREQSQRRGGGARLESLDAMETFDPPVAPAGDDPARTFDRAWARTVMQDSIAEAMQRMQPLAARVYELYDLADSDVAPSYDSIAAQLGVTYHDVLRELRTARAAVRKALEDRVRETVTNAADFEEELRFIIEECS